MAALAAGAAVLLAVVASGGTYAFLRSSTTSPGAILTAGTATLAVTTPLALPATSLRPNTSIAASAVLKNTGTVPLSVRIAGLAGPAPATGFSSALTIGVSVIDTTATCPAVSTAWTGTFANAPQTDLSVRIASLASKKVCVSVTLPATAPSTSNTGGAIAFTLTVDGRQVA